MNYYGKPYLEMFGCGREKLRNTPCNKVEKIGDDIVAIQATGNLFEEIPCLGVSETEFAKTSEGFTNFTNQALRVVNEEHQK